MKKFLVVISILIGGLMAVPVMATHFQGKDLWNVCKDAQKKEYGVCLGYVNGMARSLEGEGKICTPDTMGWQNLTRVVVVWLKTHRNLFGEPGAILVLKALTQNFPCMISTLSSPS